MALTEQELKKRESDLIEIVDTMRPLVQEDGGDLILKSYDLEKGVVEVELKGACGSCVLSGATLSQGVERILKDRLDWVTEVIGSVDDSIDPLESMAMGRGFYTPINFRNE